MTKQALKVLASCVRNKLFDFSVPIVKEGDFTSNPALFLVRTGRVYITKNDDTIFQIVEAGDFFGEEMFITNSGKWDYTAVAADETTTLGILYLEDFKYCIGSSLELDDLTLHSIIGNGAFGQVWLVSATVPAGTQLTYALKIQSKYELTEKKHVKALTRERNILAELNHPFLLHLVQTYQDESFVFMLTGLCQGGELYSLLHSNRTTFIMTESSSKFYASCILDALSYMHQRSIVYRDLKPENCLLTCIGYPTLVDFGFSKRLVGSSRTFSMCGTPLYTAPEIILDKGYSFEVDYWALGVLIYEMNIGFTPFYRKGITQEDMDRRIIHADFDFPSTSYLSMTPSAMDIIKKLLIADPARRLGNFQRTNIDGTRDITSHTWFSDVDFERLRSYEVKAPWQPSLNGPFDRSFFAKKSNRQDMLKVEYPTLSQSKQKLFDSF